MDSLKLGIVTEEDRNQLGVIFYNQTEFFTETRVKENENVVFEILIDEDNVRAVNILNLSDCLENLWYYGKNDDQINIIKYTRAVKLFFAAGIVSNLSSPHAIKGLDLYLGIHKINKEPT